MSRFTERITRHLGRPVEAACAVRPPFTTLAIALRAGAGAESARSLGGPLLAACRWPIAAYVILWFETRGSGTSLNMALVLFDEEVELVQLRVIGNPLVRTLSSIPYADIAGVERG